MFIHGRTDRRERDRRRRYSGRDRLLRTGGARAARPGAAGGGSGPGLPRRRPGRAQRRDRQGPLRRHEARPARRAARRASAPTPRRRRSAGPTSSSTPRRSASTGHRRSRSLSSTPGDKGAVSVRYQQTLKGIEVLGGQFAVRFDSERNINSLNGEAVPGGDAFDATPAIDAAAAQRAAIARHRQEREGARRDAARRHGDAAGLRLAHPRRPRLRTARRSSTQTLVSSSRNAELRRLVFVDAQRGHEVATIDETHEAKNRSVCDGANNPAGAQYPCTSPVVDGRRDASRAPLPTSRPPTTSAARRMTSSSRASAATASTAPASR